jgi:hypothetical protein
MRIFLILFILISTNAYSNELDSFFTDDCTYFPEGTKKEPLKWKECCTDHDFRYWFGGDKLDQNIADLELKRCVKQKAGGFWANLMYAGVKTGHLSPIKSKYKWGWGWRDDRKFTSLTQNEKDKIVDKSQEIKLSDEKIHELLLKNNIIPSSF